MARSVVLIWLADPATALLELHYPLHPAQRGSDGHQEGKRSWLWLQAADGVVLIWPGTSAAEKVFLANF